MAHVIPWISLSLALSFSIYGLLRKRLPVSALLGLGVEITYPMLPLMLFLSLFTPHSSFNQAFSSMSSYQLFMISLSGFFTVFPLWAFNKAVKGLRLATIGFIQYISPTLQFLTGIFVFQEAFTSGKVVAFILVWTALAILGLDLIRSRKNNS
jgi:chloramphenicol-sensitive protein RarD